MSAGMATLDAMDSTSTSTPSLAKPPISLAIQSDAIVADVLRYATLRGRLARGDTCAKVISGWIDGNSSGRNEDAAAASAVNSNLRNMPSINMPLRISPRLEKAEVENRQDELPVFRGARGGTSCLCCFIVQS